MARTKLQGYVEQGGNSVSVGGLQSTTTVQKSFPGSTVTVYTAGTTTLSTIYSDAGGTAKANPFTANSTDAYWSFFVDSGTYDITFSGTGIGTPFTWSSISVGSGGDISVSVTGLGAAGNGTTVDTAAFQAGANFGGSGNVAISIPRGTYLIDDTITVPYQKTSFIGNGSGASTIAFAPTVAGGKVLFDVVSPTAAELFRNTFRGFSITSSDTTYVKTAIQLTDTGQTVLEDIHIGTIGQWTDGTKGCIGLHTKGREEGFVHLMEIDADKPIVVSENPNIYLDLDHWHFQDINLVADSNPCVTVDDGVNITNLIFDGYQGWNKGTYGFYFNDTTTALIGQMAVFANIRWEQAQSTAGYAIYWHSNASFRNVLVQNVMTGNATQNHGVSFSNIKGLTFVNYNFSGGAKTAFDISGCDQVKFINSFFNANSTKTATGLTRIYTYSQQASNPSAGTPDEMWISTSNANASANPISLLDEFRASGTGSLIGNNSTFVLVPGLSNQAVSGFVKITVEGATAGTAIYGFTTTGLNKIGGSAAFVEGVPAGGQVGLAFVSQGNIRVFNDCSTTITYKMSAQYMF